MSSRVQQKAAARREREAREASARRAAARRRSLSRLAMIAVAALSTVTTAIYVSRPDREPVASPERTVEVADRLAGIPQHGVTLGAPDAPATLIEFADLQCPYCAVYSRDVLPTVIDRYVRAGDLKLELHVLTFVGEDSLRAGRMAAAAIEQDKLWNFADAFYLAQGHENTGYVTDDFLTDVGATAGLDVPAAMRMRERPAAQRSLDAAQADADEHGVQSTPSFLLRVGDREPEPVTPADLTPAAFTAALDTALAR